MASFSFYLDKPFKRGVNHLEVKKYIKEGKNYRKYLNPSDSAIYAWLTFDGGKYLKVHCCETISAWDWDFALKRAKRTMAGSAQLNERLEDLKAEILKQYRSLISSNPNASFEEIRTVAKNAVTGKTPTFNKKTFLERYSEYLDERRTEVKHLTYKKLKSFKTVFEEYLTWAGLKTNHFYLESINDDFNISFRNYLLEKRALVNNTASKYYEILKTFLRHCRRKGIFRQVSGDFETYSVKRDHKDVVSLTQFEIDKILELDFSDNAKLDHARDCFIFQIFTGQRHGDLEALKSTDIMLNVDGTRDWHLYQIKGNKPKKIIIPLLPEAEKILLKYGFFENPAIVRKLEVKYPGRNKMIKSICELAKIDQIITIVRYSGKKRIELTGPKWEYAGKSHCARSTFITLCIEKGMPMHQVQEISGHTNSRVLQNSYLTVSRASSRSALFSAWMPDHKPEKSDDDEKTRRLQNS